MPEVLTAGLALAVLGVAEAAAPASLSIADIIALLREFGFPIFVVIWFMWRMEKRLERYTEQLEKLCTVVTVMAKTVDARHDDHRDHPEVIT